MAYWRFRAGIESSQVERSNQRGGLRLDVRGCAYNPERASRPCVDAHSRGISGRQGAPSRSFRRACWVTRSVCDGRWGSREGEGERKRASDLRGALWRVSMSDRERERERGRLGALKNEELTQPSCSYSLDCWCTWSVVPANSSRLWGNIFTLIHCDYQNPLRSSKLMSHVIDVSLK